MARLYDTWDCIKRINYNPDGSMKEKWKNTLLESGMSPSEIYSLEQQKMNEVRLFEEREQRYIERYGIPFSEWEKQGRMSQAELESRQRKAIRNGEEISSLPMDIDPDDYYDQVGS
ncbi:MULTISPECIES: hypothetical protein [Crocosphaera]|uniref:Uncharacterized protein n=4 Tax=Crocosphaera watsonii TaxID=263511 RepID=T2IWM2_CROWT|nr:MULTISPECIES: hypothetical protein [Crocosphaera]EHJ09486.1 Phosphoribosyl-ATP pyrophosphatase [Crocosphaera watsonii WH 0003]CCQ56447.1 hypothetical protein CWATWH0005_4492 [Crocosphaera watsonii WH 0005]CCQ57294.1 hypothetical protein CWATWH0005_2783 [Crocosphaera watsonii WH 0005]CCQ64882.1 hypothetical protein CWATWH0402_5970 [Crocosphaera watsonii WH 0402]